jgi:hypothetical protein
MYTIHTTVCKNPSFTSKQHNVMNCQKKLSFVLSVDIFIIIIRLHGGGHTKVTGNCNATAISKKNRRFQAGNWFPD